MAPETAPSPAKVANPLKNLPVPSDPAAPVSQSAQETLSEKGGAAADTVKKAADEAPGFFDLLKGGLQKQAPQAAPETAPSSANEANPLKNLPVPTKAAESVSQSAQDTLSGKGGAPAEIVKKAADEAPGFFDLLKGGLQKQTPQAAPEAAPSSDNVANPLKNLPVPTKVAESVSQSAQDKLSEKGGAAADTAKKAADQAPGFFDLLKGGLLVHCLLPSVVLPVVLLSKSPRDACMWVHAVSQLISQHSFCLRRSNTVKNGASSC